MKTSSCKAKGRGLQQKIRDMYREIGRIAELADEDIESRGMGQAGTDIIFSPRARSVFNYDIECKKHKSVSVPKHFKEHYEKYKDKPSVKLLFHENDRSDTLVTLKAEDFMTLIKTVLAMDQTLDAYEEGYRAI